MRIWTLGIGNINPFIALVIVLTVSLLGQFAFRLLDRFNTCKPIKRTGFLAFLHDAYCAPTKKVINLALDRAIANLSVSNAKVFHRWKSWTKISEIPEWTSDFFILWQNNMYQINLRICQHNISDKTSRSPTSVIWYMLALTCSPDNLRLVITSVDTSNQTVFYDILCYCVLLAVWLCMWISVKESFFNWSGESANGFLFTSAKVKGILPSLELCKYTMTSFIQIIWKKCKSLSSAWQIVVYVSITLHCFW